MVTALTVFGTKPTTTTLTTAGSLATASGGTVANPATAVSNTAGYYEILSQSGTSTAQGSLPTPTGNGWLWDVTTLEGQDLIAGNYTAETRLQTLSGSATLTIIWRLYKYNGGTYTAIGTITLSSQSVTTTTTSFTSAATALAKMSFGTGDKLYTDLWVQNPSAAVSIRVIQGSTSTLGISNGHNIVTPGYQPTPAAGGHLLICDGGYGGVFT